MELFKLKLCLKSSSGQTAVEYLMLIAVMSMIIFSLMGKIKNFMSIDEEGCTANPNRFFCKMNSFFIINDEVSMKRFKLYR